MTTTSFSLVQPVKSDHLRDVMGQFATGVTVITTGPETVHGMTANAFTSVSLDPPLVLACIRVDSRMTVAVRKTGTFGVSFLDAGQSEIARWFASSSRPAGTDEFRGQLTYPGPLTGSPLFADALGWLECEVEEYIEGGDHVVLLSKVISCEQGPGRAPLLFFDGSFPTTCSHEECVQAAKSSVPAGPVPG